MNAIELAEYLEDYSEYERATDIEAAEMLRTQHAVIAGLREALDWCIAKINCPSPATVNAKQAMKDTAQFDSLNQPAYTEDFEMIDTKAIREVASVTPDSERTQFKPLTVIALLDRLEAAEKDTVRYRWMRDQGGFTLDRLIDECETILHVDAVIDAAMKEQK